MGLTEKFLEIPDKGRKLLMILRHSLEPTNAAMFAAFLSSLFLFSGFAPALKSSCTTSPLPER